MISLEAACLQAYEARDAASIRDKRKAQCRRSGNCPSDDRSADAHDLHDCGLGWAVPCFKPLLGDAACFADRVRFDDNGAMDEPADAPVRTESGVRRRCSGRRYGRINRLIRLADRIISALSGWRVFHWHLHVGSRLLPLCCGGHCVAGIPAQSDIVCDGGRTHCGNSWAPTG